MAESWECWDADTVTNGALAGKTVADLRAQLGADLLGDLDVTRIFPILTKIIDARDSLSVQVHPDDAYAQRVEHQPNGKTECWYILQRSPARSSCLAGRKNTSRAEYERRVADGTLGDILRRVPLKAEDDSSTRRHLARDRCGNHFIRNATSQRFDVSHLRLESRRCRWKTA